MEKREKDTRKKIKTNHPGISYREHPSKLWKGRPDRYYFIYYRVAGQRKMEGVGWLSEGWTLEEVIPLLVELKRNIKKGEGPKSLKEKRELDLQREADKAKKQMTFGEYAKKTFLPSVGGKKPTTLRRDKNNIELHLNPVIGNIPLRKLVPFHLEKVKKAMSEKRHGKKTKKPYSPRSIEYVLQTFGEVWNHAKRNGWVTGDSPSKGMKPKINNGRTRFLNQEDAELLLAKLKEKSENIYNIALLSLHCGLRLGEIFSLKWGDVDFENGLLLLKDTKNGKNRPAFLTERTKIMLASLPEGNPADFVFRNKEGEKIEQLSYSFRRAVEDLGLNDGVTDSRDRICFHTLRHSFASLHAAGGTDLYTIQKLLGHSTPTMTQRYSHLTQGALQKAQKNFEKTLTKTEQDTKSKVIRLRSSRS